MHVEDNGFLRLSIPAGHMKWTIGQHCFLRFTGFGLQAFSSHPFTICSLPSTQANEKSELVFYIRRQDGLTKKLYDHAQRYPGSTVPVVVDGPYGGISMQRYNDGDRLLVIAGGSGAGWILPFLELLCRHRSTQTDRMVHDDKGRDNKGQLFRDRRQKIWLGPHSLRIVLATRDTDSRVWFLRATGELLSKYSATHSPLELDIQVYLTGEAESQAERSTKVAGVEISRTSGSSSANIEVITEGEPVHVPGEEYSGRPSLPKIIHDEGLAAVEGDYALNVYVCGPDTMQHDVRNAAAKENLGILKGPKSGGVYLHAEHFSWA